MADKRLTTLFNRALLLVLLLGVSSSVLACEPWPPWSKTNGPTVSLNMTNSDRYKLRLKFKWKNLTGCVTQRPYLYRSEVGKDAWLETVTCIGGEEVDCTYQQDIVLGDSSDDHWYYVQIQASGEMIPTTSPISNLLWVFFINWNGENDKGEILSAKPTDDKNTLNGLEICWTEARTGSRTNPYNTNTMHYTLYLKDNGRYMPHGPVIGETCYTLPAGEYGVGDYKAYIEVDNPSLPNPIAPIPMDIQEITVESTMTYTATAEQEGYTLNEPMPGGIVSVKAVVESNNSDAQITGQVEWSKRNGVAKTRSMSCERAVAQPSKFIEVTCTADAIAGLTRDKTYDFTVTITDGADNNKEQKVILPVTIKEMFAPPAVPKDIQVNNGDKGEYTVTWSKVKDANAGYAIAPMPTDPNANNTVFDPSSPIPQSDKPEVTIRAKKGTKIANQYVLTAIKTEPTDPKITLSSDPVIFCLDPSSNCPKPSVPSIAQ